MHLDCNVFGTNFKLLHKRKIIVLEGGSSIIFNKAFDELKFSNSKLLIITNDLNFELFELVKSV